MNQKLSDSSIPVPKKILTPREKQSKIITYKNIDELLSQSYFRDGRK